MKVYVLVSDYNIDDETQVFYSAIDALMYADETIGKYWVEEGFNVNAKMITGGFQIFVTDTHDELLTTYFIFEREVIQYVKDF